MSKSDYFLIPQRYQANLNRFKGDYLLYSIIYGMNFYFNRLYKLLRDKKVKVKK